MKSYQEFTSLNKFIQIYLSLWQILFYFSKVEDNRHICLIYKFFTLIFLFMVAEPSLGKFTKLTFH
jgi:hypothetical protein